MVRSVPKPSAHLALDCSARDERRVAEQYVPEPRTVTYCSWFPGPGPIAHGARGGCQSPWLRRALGPRNDVCVASVSAIDPEDLRCLWQDTLCPEHQSFSYRHTVCRVIRHSKADCCRPGADVERVLTQCPRTLRYPLPHEARDDLPESMSAANGGRRRPPPSHFLCWSNT
jgi:hypothetical protein